MPHQPLFCGVRSGSMFSRTQHPSFFGSQRCRNLTCRASGSKATKVIPIFPLGLVALPYTDVPLQIFEARYRVLFSTLLWPRQGVEEGLVQKESPFLGTGEFGMCLATNKGFLAATGTILQIQEFIPQEDGRLLITTKGKQRFRVQDVVQEKPVLLCKVELLEEDDDTSPEAKKLAEEVAELYRQLLRAHVKTNEIKVADEQLEPEELTELSPGGLSYWVAGSFPQSRATQQALLEEDSTIKRLESEKEMLNRTVRYMAAALAVEAAFRPTPDKEDKSKNVPEPPPGGPD